MAVLGREWNKDDADVTDLRGLLQMYPEKFMEKHGTLF
jgi:hypothetical protein